jgi:hypothetical protein
MRGNFRTAGAVAVGLVLGRATEIADDVVQDQHHLLDVTLRQGQRRHEAQRIRPRGIKQQPGLERLRRDLNCERFTKRQRL